MNLLPKREYSLQLKCLAIAMLAVQVFTMWYLLRPIVFPLVVVGTGVWLVVSGFHWNISDTARFRIAAGAAIAFVIKARVAPVYVAAGSLTGFTQYAHVAAQFLVVLQLIAMATSQKTRVLPQAVPWLGAMAMICSGDINVTPLQRSVFQGLAVTYVVLAGAFSAANQHSTSGRKSEGAASRTVTLTALLGCVAALAWFSASTLFDHSQDLDTLISSLIDPRNTGRLEAGFTKQGRMKSIVRFRNENADKVVMRVYGKRSPGYLRGFTLDEFNQREWSIRESRVQAKLPGVADVTVQEGEEAFIFKGKPDPASKLTIWPLEDNQSMLLRPHVVACIVAEANNLGVSGDGANISAPDLPVGYPYTVYSPQEDVTDEFSPVRRARYANWSASSEDICNEIAARIFTPEQSFDQKIAAVVNHLSDIPYSDDFEIPTARKPIDWFLRERSGGHCELFATAAAQLLRTADVPTRYITGYVVPERNDFGDYWIVRRKYAHAWIEAYNEDMKQWVLVEATPGDGVPASPNPGTVSQIWNYMKERFQVFRVLLDQRGMMWLVRSMLASWTVRLLLGLVLVWLFIRLRRLRNPLRDRAGKTQLDREARILNRLLDKVDAGLRKQHGMVREPSETLFQFASRVATKLPDSKLPDWYRAYAVARYSPVTTTSVDDLTKLAAAVH